MLSPHECEREQVASEPSPFPAYLLSHEFHERVRDDRICDGVPCVDHKLAPLRDNTCQEAIVRILAVQYSGSEDYVCERSVFSSLNRDSEEGLARPGAHHASYRLFPVERQEPRTARYHSENTFGSFEHCEHAVVPSVLHLGQSVLCLVVDLAVTTDGTDFRVGKILDPVVQCVWGEERVAVH